MSCVQVTSLDARETEMMRNSTGCLYVLRTLRLVICDAVQSEGGCAMLHTTPHAAPFGVNTVADFTRDRMVYSMFMRDRSRYGMSAIS